MFWDDRPRRAPTLLNTDAPCRYDRMVVEKCTPRTVLFTPASRDARAPPQCRQCHPALVNTFGVPLRVFCSKCEGCNDVCMVKIPGSTVRTIRP